MYPRNICQSTFELVARFRATPRSIGRIVYIAFAHRITICIGAAFVMLALSTHRHGKTTSAELADGSFHLQFNQAAPLNCVFHRQCTGYGFDESVHHHAHGCFLSESTTHEIEQLLVGDL